MSQAQQSLKPDDSASSEHGLIQTSYLLTGFKAWFLCLIFQYHPIGILWNRSNTVLSKIILMFTITCHWLIASLYSIILFSIDANDIKYTTWMVISIPSATILLTVSFAGIMLIRYLVNKRIYYIMQNKEQIHKHIENNGEEFKGNYIDQSLRNEVTITRIMLVLCVLLVIKMGFSFSVIGRISEALVIKCLVSLLISWGIDLLILRISFVLILSLLFDKYELCQIFDFWQVPVEASVQKVMCEQIDIKDAKNEVEIVMKEWKSAGNTTMEEKLRSSSIITIENDIKPFDNFVKDDKENRLDTIKDDIEGEKVITARSIKNKINVKPLNFSIKENIIIEPKEKENNSFTFKGTEKQSEVCFILPAISPPCAKFDAMLYCSPLKESIKINQSVESILKTSPKKGKRAFFPEDDISLDSIEKHEKVEKELVSTIKVKVDSCVKKPPYILDASVNKINDSKDFLHNSNQSMNKLDAIFQGNLVPSEVDGMKKTAPMKQINLFGIPKIINSQTPALRHDYIFNILEPSSKPECKVDTLNLSDYELDENLVESSPKRNPTKAIMDNQRRQLKKWLKITQVHEKVQEARTISLLLEKIERTKRPVHKSEMRSLEDLEILDLPYAIKNSFPMEIAFTNIDTKLKNGVKEKSKTSLTKLSKLKGAYGNLRLNQLKPFKMKEKEKCKNGTDNIDNYMKENTVFESKKEAPKELPPLKIRINEIKPIDDVICEDELMHNKHLMKIDKIIGKSCDKVRRSFFKSKLRRTEQSIDNNIME